MFIPIRASSPRHRSASCSTDDQSFTKDRPRRLFQRHHTHDHSMSSHSLANSLHDDLPTPSFPTHASHSTSGQSTPMTSPSTGYSSLFPGSFSSATSESAPSAESKYRSEFGLLIPGSASAYSAVHGSASSRSSNPISRSRSPTESDIQSSAPRIPLRRPSTHFSDRPVTAPTSPLMLATASTSAFDHHTRSNSRLTVSIKNIFSRHAIPSPSRFSFNSAAPESEASSSSFQVPAAAGKWSVTPRKSRPPDLEISGTVAPAIPSPGFGSNTPIDAHRRYPSEAAAKSYNARTGNALPTTQQSIDVSPRNIPVVRGRDPKTRNVLRRRPSGSAKLLKGRERGMSSSRPNEGSADHLFLPSTDAMSHQGVPFPLTPAGAVVEAYKLQALHRDDVSSPSKLSIDDCMSSTTSHDGRDHPEQSPTPYYTVFGTSSERHILAGSLDGRWNRSEATQRTVMPSHPSLSHQPSMSDPGGRSLARKFSNRWQKVKGGVSEESPSRDKGHSKGRPSLQDIWRNDKSRSMDGVSNPGDGAWASPNANHARSASKGDKNEGPKFWRLMRRISTGGLRDRFQSETAVPPVPAIPKELLKKSNEGERDNDPSRYQQLSAQGMDHSRTATAPKNIAIVRPSIATSSSSPNSSDVASTQFFQKSHSPRSSVSSYGEAIMLPRAPEPLNRHIITPLEQLRLANDQAEQCPSSLPRSPRRTTSVPAGLKTVENAESDHLPLPSPRRQTCSGESPSSSSSRPCSTSPSVSGSARASHQSPSLGQSRMADGIVSLSPPPRPSRNSARGGSWSLASAPSHSMVVKHVDGVGIGIGGVRQIDRTPSGQSDMTARGGSPEPRRLQARERDRDPEASPCKRGQLTFRKLDAPRKPPLTEREKADIWNDLLAKSDKAGGTLRINGAAELLSDSMRLSTHSEV